MARIDRNKWLRYLEELSISIERLKEKKKLSKKEFLENPDAQDAVCRRFQIATECCIDLGNSLISSFGLRRPESSSDIFVVLYEYGYIDDEAYMKKMVDMVKFRHVLVHMYTRVNLEKVYQYLQEDIPLFERFQNIILNLLQ